MFVLLVPPLILKVAINYVHKAYQNTVDSIDYIKCLKNILIDSYDDIKYLSQILVFNLATKFKIDKSQVDGK